jgi:hypothetical protein
MIKTYILTRSIFPEDKERIEKDLALKSETYKYPFRLYDDDGELYYEGLSVQNESFEPLDEEQPNSGVTEIHYLNNGKWEQL